MAAVEIKSKKKRSAGNDNATKSKKVKKDDEWDIDNYRTDYESEEHWELRKQFMEVHKDKFPEERLVCLAKVFTNMEFMGCRYPAETMRLVAELSKDVAKGFRESRESRLKRTFVAASDAAEQRAKVYIVIKKIKILWHRKANANLQQKQQFNENQNNQTNDNCRRIVLGDSSDLFEGLPYGKFVLFLHGGRNCLISSSARCQMKVSTTSLNCPQGGIQVDIYIETHLIASAKEANMKLARAEAFKRALEEIQKNCYSIKRNGKGDTIKIGKSDDNKLKCEVLKDDKKIEQKLDEDNKGYKMMKLMGWAGGGLGSRQQGREDPVGYLFKNNRLGLGLQVYDKQFFSEILQNYTNSDDIRQLRFEPSFTKDERAMLHELATKYGLKSQSYGSSEERHLVISKKNVSNEQILQEILLNKNASYCDQYVVQVPQCKAHLFPDHTEHLDLQE